MSFYGWHQADKFIAAWREAGFRLAGHLTFTKWYPSAERFLQYRHENAYLLAKGNPAQPTQRILDVLEWKYSGNRLHPTQKPLCVLTPLIQSVLTSRRYRSWPILWLVRYCGIIPQDRLRMRA